MVGRYSILLGTGGARGGALRVAGATAAATAQTGGTNHVFSGVLNGYD